MAAEKEKQYQIKQNFDIIKILSEDYEGLYYFNLQTGRELVLSGHAHGGQWQFFGHGVWAPGQGWWPRYTKGVYVGRLVVSAGLSNTTWVPRICNPTEVVYIEP